MPISDGSTLQVISLGDTSVKISAGNDLVYPNSTGAVVTYYIDTNSVYTEEVDSGASCLSPTSFTPSKDGWEFAGWRQDTVASGDVLDGLVMDDEPITLYAVFQQNITLSYEGNGNTGGTAVNAETKTRYYNNNTVLDPIFTVKANTYVRTNYNFVQWLLNGISETAYTPDSQITLDQNATLYAEWKHISNPFYWIRNNVADNGQQYSNTVVSASDAFNGVMYYYATAQCVANTSATGNIKVQSNSINTKSNQYMEITIETNQGGKLYVNGNILVTNGNTGTFKIDVSKYSSVYLYYDISSPPYSNRTITVSNVRFY